LKWCKNENLRQGRPASIENIKNIFEIFSSHIRFGSMSSTQLSTTIKNSKMLENEFLFQLLLSAASNDPIEKSISQSLGINMKIKRKHQRTFQYKNDFDENGLIYFIGTKGEKTLKQICI
jgi:hypothetical protein